MNYHKSKLDCTLLELLNMLKIVEGALKKEKGLSSSRMSKKMDKKNKGVVSKAKNLLGASKKTRAFIIIVERKNIG